jgi:hypothetical protein
MQWACSNNNVNRCAEGCVYIPGSNPFFSRGSLARAGAMIAEKSNSFGRSSGTNTR